MTESVRTRLSELGADATRFATHRFEIQSAVRHRVLDLATPEHRKLSNKLHDWWTFDFAAFRAEVKRIFRNDIALKDRDEWERYLSENAAKVRSLSAALEEAEHEIDQIVYRLFDLTTDEIRLLEASLEEHS